MKKKRTPKIFYKFHPYNTFLLQLLASNHLYCPNYEQLNDPYDCRVIFSDLYIKGMFEGTHPIRNKDINKIFEEFMSKINTKTRSVELVVNTIEAKLAVINAYYGDFVAVLLKHLNHNVVSFSRNKDLSQGDILMWGHYTGTSRGVKLKFNFSDSISQMNIARTLEPVIYTRMTEVQSENELSKALFCKTIGWKYEKEYRIIRTDDNKIRFEPYTLEEITFGYNVGPEERNALIKVVKNLRVYSKCKFSYITFNKGRLAKEMLNIEEFKANQNVVVNLRINGINI